MAMSATSYMCHLKVTVNDVVSEQDQVLVEVNKNNGGYDLSLKNFCLESDGNKLPVGNIAVSGVQGVNEYGYTTITINEPVIITAGDDPSYTEADWLGPMLGEVPIDLTSRFTDSALSANIDIEMPGMMIGVSIFGVTPVLQGDVNHDNAVNISALSMAEHLAF
jgi:hypothetical protein